MCGASADLMAMPRRRKTLQRVCAVLALACFAWRLRAWMSLDRAQRAERALEKRRAEIALEERRVAGGVRVALCFFGLPGALSLTIGSIREHILEPLSRGNIKYNTFVHAYTSRTQQASADAGGASFHLSSSGQATDLKLLNATRVMVSNVEDYDKVVADNQKIFDAKFSHYKYPEPEAVIDIIRSRHSMEMVWDVMDAWMLETEAETFDAVVYFNADMLFLTDLDLPNRLPLPEQRLFIPKLEPGKMRGVNDRFAFGDVDSMHVYAHQVEVPGSPELNTEDFLEGYLRKNKIAVTAIDFPFSSILADGTLSQRDIKYITPRCQLNRSRSACELLQRIEPGSLLQNIPPASRGH
ncbi:unnamed protein product [Chrysoparadoxa australica]